MNDYFSSGMWEKLKNDYSKVKKKGHSNVFFGDSMTEYLKGYFTESDSVVNMGICGDFTQGLIKRINNVTDFYPDNVFIMIGINDIIEKVPINETEENYRKIINLIQSDCPRTRIYIQSTLPTYGLAGTFSSSKDINNRVQELNRFLKIITKEKGIIFIDMYNDFVNSKNELRPELTIDGIHLNEAGNNLWLSHVKEFMN